MGPRDKWRWSIFLGGPYYKPSSVVHSRSSSSLVHLMLDLWVPLLHMAWHLLSQRVLTILTWAFPTRAWVLNWREAHVDRVRSSIFVAFSHSTSLSSACRSWMIHRCLISSLLALVAAVSASHQIGIHQNLAAWRPNKPCVPIPPSSDTPSHRPFEGMRGIWKSWMQFCKPIRRH